jgi:hypothetical protein
MGPPTQWSGSRCIILQLRPLVGLTRRVKLYAGLIVIIHQDLAPRASRGVSSFLEPLMPAVHQ